MAYAIRYRCDVVWLAPGRGLGMDSTEQLGPNVTGGNAQVLSFFDVSHPSSTTFTATDVTNLTNAMAADLSAQMSAAAILARVQAFATGGG